MLGGRGGGPGGCSARNLDGRCQGRQQHLTRVLPLLGCRGRGRGRGRGRARGRGRVVRATASVAAGAASGAGGRGARWRTRRHSAGAEWGACGGAQGGSVRWSARCWASHLRRLSLVCPEWRSRPSLQLLQRHRGRSGVIAQADCSARRTQALRCAGRGGQAEPPAPSGALVPHRLLPSNSLVLQGGGSSGGAELLLSSSLARGRGRCLVYWPYL
jgi:hypothetical protein